MGGVARREGYADLSRKKFLGGLAATLGLGTLYPAVPALARRRRKTLVRTATATRPGEYLYLPFEVPRGVNGISVKLTKSDERARVGVGLFDHQGARYESPGFRGVYGEERSEFFVGARRASLSFVPGPIRPGRWTVIVPVFLTAAPTRIWANINLLFGPQGTPARPGPLPRAVNDRPGWYRGELHCHTPHSSDARASGSALTPAGWADRARELGLDFVSLTDHNVTSQNRNLKDAAGKGVLLLAGEEMTNWFHGHATVAGLKPGDHLDWRQRPLGVQLGKNEARIQRFISEARRLGAYTSAAHPFAGPIAWQFFPDAEADPEGALTDGIEVWNGPFQPDDELSIRKWDEFLLRGVKIWANGGSDTHGIKNTGGFAPGHPTNVVYADALSREGIVAALKAGRVFVTRLPDGAELYLSATGPGGQRQIVGGTVYGAASDIVRFSVLVRKGAANSGKNPMLLTLLRDGVPVQVTPITEDEQQVTFEQPIGTGGYVRAELRAEPVFEPPNVPATRGPMEALTNPIFLSDGPETR
ncbi:MAG: PHP domain-containing protein, partial [Rubrobacter sp.]|nr:PHP domain-containing protein [Rubrobacter sp.]